MVWMILMRPVLNQDIPLPSREAVRADAVVKEIMAETQMWLLIDDERNLGCDVVARTPRGGKEMLRQCKWDGLCLDHDLGDGESGYDILMWALGEGVVPPRVELVTSNPGGRDRMGAALEGAGYIRKSPTVFIRPEVE
jgi:hypothetical protein